MPNHVTNYLHFPTKKSAHIIAELMVVDKESGELRVDFNKIIPMPDDIFTGNLGDAERAIHGTKNWYDWSLENWGTKWNAYETHCNKDGRYFAVTFYTAWSPPGPILEKIRELFGPFDYAFFDEGDGIEHDVDDFK